MARKYYAGEASHFLLHHNIYDLVRSGAEYISLPNYLQRELIGSKYLVTYNRSEGIRFGSSEAERAFQAQRRVADPLLSRDRMSQLPREPAGALSLIEQFLLSGDQVAVLINFLETIIPAGEVSYMSGDDRTNLVALQRWITSSRLLKKDNIVILIAESQADIHPRIRENSRLVSIEVPYPDDQERLEFIGYMRSQTPALKMEVTDDQLALMTSGLNRVHLTSLIKGAASEPEGITLEKIKQKKKELNDEENCVGVSASNIVRS